jgi:nitrogen fixation/metabolism regulation signal transduction histidine kinase
LYFGARTAKLKCGRTFQVRPHFSEVVEVIVKTSNSLRTFVNEWSEFFKYNPPVFENTENKHILQAQSV